MKVSTRREALALLSRTYAEREAAADAVARAPLHEKVRLVSEWVEKKQRMDEALKLTGSFLK